MKLTPKITRPVHAVRLTHEVIADKGQWILFMDDDSVKVMDDAEVKAAFHIDGSTTSTTKTTPSGRKPRTQYTRGSITVAIGDTEVSVGGQLARVLVAADRVTRMPNVTNFTSSSLTQYLNGHDVEQIAARLHDAHMKKYVIKVAHDGVMNRSTWALSNEGRALARALASSDLSVEG